MLYLVGLSGVRRLDGRVSRRRRARAVRRLAGALPPAAWLEHPDRVDRPRTPSTVRETVLVVHDGDPDEIESALERSDAVDWYLEIDESPRGWPYGPFTVRR